MSGEETQIDLVDRMREALAPMLANEQEKTAKNSLSNNNPERWLSAASMFLAGSSVHEVKKTLDMHHYIARRINGVVKASDEARLFRQERAIQLVSTIDEISSIGEKIAASYLDGSEEAEEKIKKAETKDLANLAVAQEKLHRTGSRKNSMYKLSAQVKQKKRTYRLKESAKRKHQKPYDEYLPPQKEAKPVPQKGLLTGLTSLSVQMITLQKKIEDTVLSQLGFNESKEAAELISEYVLVATQIAKSQ